MMTTITSRTNPLIKQIVKLHDAQHRAQEQLFIAEGLRVCSTLLDAGVSCTHLFYTKETQEQKISLRHLGESILVPSEVMEKISTSKSPSGILGVFNIPQESSKPLSAPGLVLAQIQDPGNMGTLIRTAAAVNVKSVVIIEGCDPWSPKVVQASAGTIGMVNIKQWSWEILKTQKGSLPLIALVINNGTSIKNTNLKNGLLIVGNEARGIPAEWLKDCEYRVTLPMPGGTESLNAAVAGSIALYMGCMN